MPTLHEMWQTFDEKVVPDHADKVQRQVMKESFLLGAYSIWKAMTSGMAPEHEEALRIEMEEFAATIIRDALNKGQYDA